VIFPGGLKRLDLLDANSTTNKAFVLTYSPEFCHQLEPKSAPTKRLYSQSEIKQRDAPKTSIELKQKHARHSLSWQQQSKNAAAQIEPPFSGRAPIVSVSWRERECNGARQIISFASVSLRAGPTHKRYFCRPSFALEHRRPMNISCVALLKTTWARAFSPSAQRHRGNSQLSPECECKSPDTKRAAGDHQSGLYQGGQLFKAAAAVHK